MCKACEEGNHKLECTCKPGCMCCAKCRAKTKAKKKALIGKMK